MALMTLMIVTVATTLIVLFAAFCIAGGISFVRRAARPIHVQAGESLPRCAVLLALRGTDTHLEECLRALCRQDYPSYRMLITIDDEADPEWTLAHDVVRSERAEHVHIAALRERHASCSLKCSALLQMTAALDADVDVVAFIDGDVVPHAHWLRDLVAPLHESGVGATFGVPWHASARPQWGSVLRNEWWMFAALMMVWRGWAWGGTCALRVETLRQAGIERRWQVSLSSDTPLHDALASLGLSARWVPSLIMLNRDQCSLRSFFPQLVRYLLVRRLYLPHWRRERFIGAVLGAALLVNLAAIAYSMMTGKQPHRRRGGCRAARARIRSHGCDVRDRCAGPAHASSQCGARAGVDRYWIDPRRVVRSATVPAHLGGCRDG
jgi:cellulose synthase/poly-beta-1,6-N-acetylglucosamine synthase-like glycosyltransferase